MNHQQIFDPFFIETALHLGYRKEDLQLLNQERILLSSKPTMKGISQIQKAYYIKKKAQADQIRRQKIIKEVTQEVEKQKSKNLKRSSFNPIVTNVLRQHEVKPERKTKEIQKPIIRKKSLMKNICNTIDFGKTTPNFNTFIEDQEFVRQPMKSQGSRSSSSQNSSEKHEKTLTGQKQKEKEEQRKNTNKRSKVIEKRFDISCKLKTRSQISNQSARERQREVENIYSQELTNQFKIFHSKNLNNKNSQENKIHSKEKREIKNLLLSQSKERSKNIYDNKMKILPLSKPKIEFQMQSKRTLRQEKQEMKEKYKRLHKERIEEQSKRKTMYYGMKSLENAQKLRQNDKKFNSISNRVKVELFRKNQNSLQIKREIQNSKKKSLGKSNELVEIEKLKRKLNKQSTRYRENQHKYSSYNAKRNISFFY